MSVRVLLVTYWWISKLIPEAIKNGSPFFLSLIRANIRMHTRKRPKRDKIETMKRLASETYRRGLLRSCVCCVCRLWQWWRISVCLLRVWVAVLCPIRSSIWSTSNVTGGWARHYSPLRSLDWCWNGLRNIWVCVTWYSCTTLFGEEKNEKEKEELVNLQCQNMKISEKRVNFPNCRLSITWIDSLIPIHSESQSIIRFTHAILHIDKQQNEQPERTFLKFSENQKLGPIDTHARWMKTILHIQLTSRHIEKVCTEQCGRFNVTHIAIQHKHTSYGRLRIECAFYFVYSTIIANKFKDRDKTATE